MACSRFYILSITSLGDPLNVSFTLTPFEVPPSDHLSIRGLKKIASSCSANLRMTRILGKRDTRGWTRARVGEEIPRMRDIMN
jgi:hypothetical protein